MLICPKAPLANLAKGYCRLRKAHTAKGQPRWSANCKQDAEIEAIRNNFALAVIPSLFRDYVTN